MAGKGDHKIIAETIASSGHGWTIDPAHHNGAASAYRNLFGMAPAFLYGGRRVGSGRGRGPAVIDCFRENNDRIEFLSVKGHKPWPSKASITTAAGAEAAIFAADMGCNLPMISMAIFDGGRVGVRAFDLADLIREHGVATAPKDGGFGKGKAPALYFSQTTRASGVKSAQKLVDAGFLSPEDAAEMTTRTYARIDMSYAALGVSKGNGWKEFAPKGDNHDVRGILAYIEDSFDWPNLTFEPTIG